MIFEITCLRLNLDQFLPQRRQCPMKHRLRQHRLKQEVAHFLFGGDGLDFLSGQRAVVYLHFINQARK